MSIVRRALRGILPETIRSRRDIGSIESLRTLGLRDHERPTIEAWLADPLLAQFGFVNAAALRAQYHRYCSGQRGEFGLNYAIVLESWLRQVFGVNG
jgi:hypothetical protein